MKTIPLTKGYSTIVDDDDYEELSKYSWALHVRNKKSYARTTIWNHNKRTHVLMHRMILNHSGKESFVDHVNGDSLDNRRDNLRLCTHQENCMNRKPQSNSATGINGVTKYKDGYRVIITFQGKAYWIGYAKTIDQGREMRRVKEEELFKEFSPLKNIVRGME